MNEAVQSPLRITQLHVRAGYLENVQRAHANRGADPFIPECRDETLGFVAKELVRVEEAYGNEAIYSGSHG